MKVILLPLAQEDLQEIKDYLSDKSPQAARKTAEKIKKSLQLLKGKCSVPLLKKEGLGEILLNKSPSIPLFQRGR